MSTFSTILPVYAADTAGVCSMLYELGGMVVVHDASGCNSTYATHDEPRWQHHPSRIFISALTEQDAILGNDQRLVDDVCQTAATLTPRFIALCGSPVPMMIGTDFDALAYEIEQRTGIPTLPLHTSGMQPYTAGAGEALTALLRRFCPPSSRSHKNTGGIRVNLLGATPLDFPRPDTVDRLHSWLTRHGMILNAALALGGCTLEQVAAAGNATVNLVLSSCGFPAARLLAADYGIPAVAGVPYGCAYAAELAQQVREAATTGVSPAVTARHTGLGAPAVIGEPVGALSLACAAAAENGTAVRVLSPVGIPAELTGAVDGETNSAEAMERELAAAAALYADPLYAPMFDTARPFHAWPSYAFSGRCCRNHFPQLIETPLSF